MHYRLRPRPDRRGRLERAGGRVETVRFAAGARPAAPVRFAATVRAVGLAPLTVWARFGAAGRVADFAERGRLPGDGSTAVGDAVPSRTHS